MAKKPTERVRKPADVWKRYPGDDDKEMVKSVQEFSDFMNVPVEDFIYYVIADMILADLRPHIKRGHRNRVTWPAMQRQIMERLSLLDYGKELLSAKINGKKQR